MIMYDVLVIGCGPGGYAAALQAAKKGGKVAIVEASKPGGTCVNAGCIPCKIWTKASDFVTSVQSIQAFGIKAEIKNIAYKTIVERKDNVAGDIQTGMASLLDNRGVELIKGKAVFKSPTSVTVDGKTLESKTVIIATGSSLDIPKVKGLDKAFMTTDDFLDMTEIPESVLVLGAEYIEIEIASILNAFGCKVVMATSARRILQREDQEISQRIKQSLVQQGIEILTGLALESVSPQKSMFDCLLSGAKEQTVSASRVLVSSRKANTADLGLSEIGLTLREDGSIPVNDYLETNVTGIYAIGDVAGEWMLSHEASSMGMIAAENSMGGSTGFNRNLIPRGLWSAPEMGCVGMSEAEAEKNGFDVEVGTYPYAISGYAMGRDEQDGVVKIIADSRYDEILGVHIVGKHAVEIVGEAVMAMQLECTSKELAKSIRLHPTFSEIVIDAAKGIEF